MSQDNGLLQRGKCQDDIFAARHIYPGTFFCLMPYFYFFFLLCQAMNDADFALMCPGVAVTLCASGKLGPRSFAEPLINKVCVSFPCDSQHQAGQS